MDEKAVVLFDGSCAFCRKSVGILQRLDWFGRLSYHNARDLENMPSAQTPLEPQRLLEEMHLLVPTRQRSYAGFKAFRWMAGRLPLLWALWPWLFLPGVPWLGQRLYRWVAKNRYNLIPCQHGQCALRK